MKEKLNWTVPGEAFEDGSHLSDWTKIESSPLLTTLMGRADWSAR